jgi:hypothetical protein
MYFIYLSLIFLFFPISIFLAQGESKGLIFNEVYLDKDKPGKSWIEIYNPEEIPLILKSLRIFGIRTPNILPAKYREQNGIENL